ncbi:MAG: GNAT family N-acetyltransferase [Nanoarchaeota archaeon]|nr:GNAT family N-acetyltransferase [Nanoarchaeota archaeon]
MEKLRITLIKTKTDYAQAIVIRYKVFVLEQKVPAELEIEHEDNCAHFLAAQDKTPVGCARVRKVGKKLKLERLAILKEHRGKGYGKEIVLELVNYCRRKKPEEIYMNAQYYLLDFYKALGFVQKGKKFEEAGIEHIKMVLNT